MTDDTNRLDEVIDGTQTGVAAGFKMMPWTPIVLAYILYYRLRYGRWIIHDINEAIDEVR